jgi:hypothetical protein
VPVSEIIGFVWRTYGTIIPAASIIVSSGMDGGVSALTRSAIIHSALKFY